MRTWSTAGGWTGASWIPATIGSTRMVAHSSGRNHAARDPRNALALRKPWLPEPPILESQQLAIDEHREEEYLRGRDLHNGYINEFDEEEGDNEAWKYYRDCKRCILRKRERERKEAEWNWMRAREQHAMELRRRNAPLRGAMKKLGL